MYSGRRNKFLGTAGWQDMRMSMILSVYQLILSWGQSPERRRMRPVSIQMGVSGQRLWHSGKTL